MFAVKDSIMVCSGPYNRWVGYVQEVGKQNTVRVLLFDSEGNSVDHVCDIENVLNLELIAEVNSKHK